MMKKLCLGLVAVACVALVSFPALAQEPMVFFSDVGTVGGGVAVGNPYLQVPLGGSATLYLWSTDNQNYDTSIGMNVEAGPEGAIAFTGGDVANPELLSMALGGVGSGEFRWQDAGVNSGNPVEADIVRRMNAVHVTEGTGITTDNDGTQGLFKLLDPLWDQDAGAFLLGSVSFDAVKNRITTLSINQTDTALFVNDGQGIAPVFGTATVEVPEPTTLVLIAFGLVALAGYGLRKR